MQPPWQHGEEGLLTIRFSRTAAQLLRSRARHDAQRTGGVLDQVRRYAAERAAARRRLAGVAEHHQRRAAGGSGALRQADQGVAHVLRRLQLLCEQQKARRSKGCMARTEAMKMQAARAAENVP